MTTQDSTPPDLRNELDPVAEAMRRADLSTTTAREEFAERTRKHAAELAAQAHRAAVLKTWRACPDVMAFVAEQRASNDFASWSDLRVEFDPKWGVHDERTLLARACHGRIGMADLCETDRAIVVERHPFETRPLVDPPVRKWALLRDAKTTCPLDSSDAWAQAYRSALPVDLRDRGMLVGTAAGMPPVIAVWLGTSQSPGMIRQWLSGEGRFTLEHESSQKYDYQRGHQAYSIDDWLTLEPTVKARSLAELAFKPTEPIGLLPSGLAELDRLRGGIQRRGDRVIIQAETGNAKTALALTMAASLASRGFKVAWVATSDELAASIIARLLQRTGKYTFESAKDHVNDTAALASLDPNLTIIDGTTVLLEDVLDSAPDFVFIDNLQKVLSRVGAGRGEMEAIAAVLKLIEAEGTTTVLTSRMNRGVRNRLEGSSGGAPVAAGATVLLDLVLKGDVLDVEILKGRGPGEHESFSLTLDRAKQTLAPCQAKPEPVSETEAHRRDLIIAALGKGPKTAGALRTWVPGHNRELKASLDALVAGGKVVLNGKEYALKDPA